MPEAADEGGVDVPVDLNAILAKHLPSLTSSEPAPAPAPAPETPAPPSAVAQAAAQVAATPAPTPPADPAVPATLEAEPTLKARQLAQLARLEADARAMKEKYEALIAEHGTKPPAAPLPSSMEELREAFELDPDAALASLGFDDRSPIATRLMYKALGAEAPPELRQQMEERRRDAEIAALKRKVEKRDKDAGTVHQQAIHAARIEATDRELSGFAHSVPPEMRFLAHENPQEIYNALCQVASVHVNAGRFPSARECAQAIEDQLAADYARLSKAVSTQAATPPAPSTPAPTPSPPRPLETLNDADTRARPGQGDQPTAEQLHDPAYWTQRAMAKLKAMGFSG